MRDSLRKDFFPEATSYQDFLECSLCLKNHLTMLVPLDILQPLSLIDYDKMLKDLLPNSYRYSQHDPSRLLEFGCGIADICVEETEEGASFVFQCEFSTTYNQEVFFYSNSYALCRYFSILYAYYWLECGFTQEVAMDKLYSQLLRR